MRETSSRRNRSNSSTYSNSNNNNKSYKRVKKAAYNYHKLYAGILATVMILCCMVLFFYKSESSASNEPHREVYYTSIEIQPGDSLWSIAQEHYTDDWEDVNTYMNAIKEFNGITNDVIHSGNYLSIPYIVEVK